MKGVDVSRFSFDFFGTFPIVEGAILYISTHMCVPEKASHFVVLGLQLCGERPY